MPVETQKGLRSLGMATTYQRASIRTLLYRNNLPCDYISVMHRDLFKDLEDARLGRNVNDFLLELTMIQAGMMIRALQGKLR